MEFICDFLSCYKIESSYHEIQKKGYIRLAFNKNKPALKYLIISHDKLKIHKYTLINRIIDSHLFIDGDNFFIVKFNNQNQIKFVFEFKEEYHNFKLFVLDIIRGYFITIF